jgi:hypothetical protein
VIARSAVSPDRVHLKLNGRRGVAAGNRSITKFLGWKSRRQRLHFEGVGGCSAPGAVKLLLFARRPAPVVVVSGGIPCSGIDEVSPIEQLARRHARRGVRTSTYAEQDRGDLAVIRVLSLSS